MVGTDGESIARLRSPPPRPLLLIGTTVVLYCNWVETGKSCQAVGPRDRVAIIRRTLMSPTDPVILYAGGLWRGLLVNVRYPPGRP